MKSKSDQLQCHFTDKRSSIFYRGLKLTVLPDVFIPRAISRFKAPSPKNYRMYQNKRVLDMGSGTGVQGLIALKSGAKHLTAVDINPVAVANTVLNLQGLKTPYTVIKSDLFENITEGFDTIIAYLPSINAKAFDLKERAIYDQDFSTFKNFLSTAARHLSPNGTIYTCWLDIEGSLETFLSEVVKNNYEIEHTSKHLHEGEDWYMFDLKLKKPKYLTISKKFS